MISEFFVNLFMQVAAWIGDLFPAWEPPDELVNASGAVKGVLSTMSGLGVWVDWGVLGACVLASLAAWGVVLLIKIIRAVLAHIPAFGGAGD